MKQKIAVDFDVIEKLIKNCFSGGIDINKIGLLYEFQKMIKQYHYILADINKADNHSEWDERCRKLSDELKSGLDDFKKYFDDHYMRSNSNIIRCIINSKECKVYEELASSSPDKILVHENKESSLRKDINYYTAETFISNNNVKPQCVLLRFPKVVDIKARYRLQNLNFILTYIRNAKSIEFCDPYLFSHKYESDIKLITDLLKASDRVESICCRYNIPEIDHKFNIFRQEIRKINTKATVKCIQYNSSTNKNHDRFIIVDENECSIRLSSSFNNLACMEDGSYKVNKGMLITFETGRKYLD